MDPAVQKSMTHRVNVFRPAILVSAAAAFRYRRRRMTDLPKASNPLPSQVDVVVIGAGAAGIAAARR